MPKQIIAIGGAMGKSLPDARLLFQYILGQTKPTYRQQPKLLVICTASGDSQNNSLRIYRELSGLECTVTQLNFFERTPRQCEMRDLVLDQDAIFVGGGNTKSMLAVWRAYGFADVLREAWEKGVVLSGSSAGGICWYQDCLTDSYAGAFTPLECLGFLKGSCCPHFDGEAGRKETYFELRQQGKLSSPGIAIDERVAVHYVNDKIFRVVTTGNGTGAYSVWVADSENGCATLPSERLVASNGHIGYALASSN